MAYKDGNNFDRAEGEAQADNTQILQVSDGNLDLPDESFVRNADISRDGADLVLDGPDGTIIIESYFSQAQSPILTAPNGATLSPQLVDSFISSGNDYAQSESMSDVSPVGAVQEITGNATITRGDGSTHELSIGSPVYQGDVIETSADAAVNVTFIDESSFAVSEDTRLAIDEYVFDPSSQGGVQNFSVLKGVFVYTSGLIGREDPDDVSIETPVGSIGIRGTIIAGDVNSGEITVVEGAIVLRDVGGNEMTLANQFETGRFTGDNGIENLGQRSANDVVEKFSIVSNVAPNLFSSINDVAAENAPEPTVQEQSQPTVEPTVEDAPVMQKFDADGTTDQNNDSQVDGTVDEGMKMDAPEGEEGALLKMPEDTESETMTNMDGETANPTIMKIAKAMGMMGDDSTSTMMETDATTTMTNTMTMSMTSSDTMMGKDTTLQTTTDSKTSLTTTTQTMDTTMVDMPMSQTLLKKIADSRIDGSGTGSAPTAFHTLGNGALAFASIAPDDYFAAGEGSAWNYSFRPEFDHSATSFSLSATTQSTLNALEANGIIQSGGINFNASNGRLTLDFANDFSGEIADNDSMQIQIEVAATNSYGTSNYVSYDFDIYNNDSAAAPGSWTAFPLDISGSNIIYNSPGNTASGYIEIGQSATTNNIDVLLNGGGDNVYLGNNSQVTNSTINLGSGNNRIETTDGTSSTGNTIIGGQDRDEFIIDEVENTFHGMGGDDMFEISLDDISGVTDQAIDKLTDPNSFNILIDGGTSGFRAKSTVASGTQQAGGRGDTLRLVDDGNIDFRFVEDSYIRGMERLELGTGNQTVTLSYEDVIQMTDGRNTLLIRADGGDNITFDNFAGRGFTDLGTRSIDDTAGNVTPTTADDTSFDVYSNGDVTLIVESGANTNATAEVLA